MKLLSEQQIIDTKFEYYFNPEKSKEMDKEIQDISDPLTKIKEDMSKELSLIGHVLLVKDFGTNKIKIVNPTNYEIKSIIPN